MSIIPALQKRYATKVFDPNKTVNSADLQILIDSLILTPSSFGLQPWHFVIVQNAEIKNQLKGAAFGQNQVANCSHLVVLCARTDLTTDEAQKFVDFSSQVTKVPAVNLASYTQVISGFIGAKNPEELTKWTIKQVYIALGFLIVACADLGIDSCPMEGFDPKQVDQILNLSAQGLTAAVLCPIGYRGEDKYASAPKVRYTQNDLVTLI